MKKIIFIAALFFVTIFANISFAMTIEKVNWENVHKVKNRAEFMEYVNECKKKFQTEIPVVIMEKTFITSKDIFSDDGLIFKTTVTFDDKSEQNVPVFCKIQYYPGTKVAAAYLSGNTSFLSSKEKELYNVAVEIVNEAKLQPTPLRSELFIHDAITSRATYYNENLVPNTEEIPNFVTAYGALIDGKANCQGYSDAFYMLGKMCGFNVGKISGITHDEQNPQDKENHAWNTITFDDNKSYFVDVTWNDDSFRFSKKLGYNSYIYFNAPEEIAETTHSWNKESILNLQSEVDERYFFMTPEFNVTNGEYFGFYSRTLNLALNKIARRIALEKRKLSWAIIPWENEELNGKKTLDTFVNKIMVERYHRYGTYGMAWEKRGNYLLLFIDMRTMKK